MNRFSKLRLVKARPLLAVSDVLENAVALNEKELLVDKLDVQRVAETVIRQRRKPGKAVEEAFSELAVELF